MPSTISSTVTWAAAPSGIADRIERIQPSAGLPMARLFAIVFGFTA
jgi:hypothetical protein